MLRTRSGQNQPSGDPDLDPKVAVYCASKLKTGSGWRPLTRQIMSASGLSQNLAVSGKLRLRRNKKKHLPLKTVFSDSSGQYAHLLSGGALTRHPHTTRRANTGSSQPVPGAHWCHSAPPLNTASSQIRVPGLVQARLAGQSVCGTKTWY